MWLNTLSISILITRTNGANEQSNNPITNHFWILNGYLPENRFPSHCTEVRVPMSIFVFIFHYYLWAAVAHCINVGTWSGCRRECCPVKMALVVRFFRARATRVSVCLCVCVDRRSFSACGEMSKAISLSRCFSTLCIERSKRHFQVVVIASISP